MQDQAPIEPDSRTLEMAHVLFMDIVAYSSLLMDQQEQTLRRLQEIVRKTVEFTKGQANNQLIRLPTGDGMALVFFGDPEAPARCALEVSRALQLEPLKLRMGIHTGPVYRVADINANLNVAGGGINIAQRVMDCGDVGHILVSVTLADVLGQLSLWSPMLHDLGEAEVKHGYKLHVYNLYNDEAGNLELPKKFSSVQAPPATMLQRARALPLWWMFACLAIAIAAGGAGWYRGKIRTSATAVKFLRLTDFAGMEDSPAFSPDGKSIAFVSDSTGSRQIWIRLLSGGPSLQITHGAGEHLDPRWLQDSTALLYYTPPPQGGAQGTLWEVSALGGVPRSLVSGISGADVSHDGKRLAFFRLSGKQMELVSSELDGSNEKVVMQAVASFSYRHPRWSPDDSNIAYLHSLENWSDDVYVVPAAGGTPRQVTHDNTLMSGFAWLPDGSRMVYSSARGETLLYLPTLHLWLVPKSGRDALQLTFGEDWDESPDVDRGGKILVSRKRMRFNIWKFPTGVDPAENVRRGVRLTDQTGQVQTPTLDPNDHELAYLSDNGGHGNLWVQKLAGGDMRQITYEQDTGVTMGVPIWSPDGNSIAFAASQPSQQGRGILGYSLIHPDGSDLRRVISSGDWATWSIDSKWLYYSESSTARARGNYRLMKIPAAGGSALAVRSDNARGPALAPDGSLYYLVPSQNLNGSLDYELRVARPEDGPSTLLTRISGERVPLWQGLDPVISKDGKWLAMPLDDSLGTNIWMASTADGKLTRITDFGQKRTFIARRISWSSDGRWVFAAVGEGDADIVQMEGLLP